MPQSYTPPPLIFNILAIDASTDQLDIALQTAQGVTHVQEAGAARSSTRMLPIIQTLLAQADIGIPQLHAIAFGQGPGAFTGLRTACSCAQGLAFAHKIPVIPINTLHAMAQSAINKLIHHKIIDCTQKEKTLNILSILDARMKQVYAQTLTYKPHDQTWSSYTPIALTEPRALQKTALTLHCKTDCGIDYATGNAFHVYNDFSPWVHDILIKQNNALEEQLAQNLCNTTPSAVAMLQLASCMLKKQQFVNAKDALPLYVRDHVAQTIEERAAQKAPSISP